MARQHERQRSEGVGKVIARQRALVGLSQAQAAAKVGVGQSAWARWESGRTMPTIDKVPTIARVLRLDTANLYEMIAKAILDEASERAS